MQVGMPILYVDAYVWSIGVSVSEVSNKKWTSYVRQHHLNPLVIPCRRDEDNTTHNADKL